MRGLSDNCECAKSAESFAKIVKEQCGSCDIDIALDFNCTLWYINNGFNEQPRLFVDSNLLLILRVTNEMTARREGNV